jgi:hypothetical protein
VIETGNRQGLPKEKTKVSFGDPEAPWKNSPFWHLNSIVYNECLQLMDVFCPCSY